MKKSPWKAVAMGAALCLPSVASAQDVNLRSIDGAFELSGELIEYQDNVYVIRTELGALRVSGNDVECFGGGCPDVEVLDNEVTFAGSDTVALGLLPVLLAGYAAHVDAELQVTETIGSVETNAQFFADQGFGDLMSSYRVRSSISSDAFANLLGKSAEIGVSSRRIKIEEARTLKEFGAGSMVSVDNEHILANDSIIVITHPSNPVKSITIEQLAGIYNGSISNWSELGGANASINAVQLKRGAGTRSVFDARVTADFAAGQPVFSTEAGSVLEASRTVGDDPNAIGYVSLAFKRGAHAMTVVNSCGIAMEPDAFSAKTGEYFLQRPLYFYTRGDTLNDQARDFMAWAQSDAADAAISKTGFVDLGIDRMTQGADSVRVANLLNAGLDNYEQSFADEMITKMADHDRLSTTFRFRAGSNRLTPQSRVGMERLVNYLAAQPAGDVILAGFTDDQGPFDSNLQFSIKRAEHMIGEIRNAAGGRLDHINLVAKGYGELSPVACNASDAGRAINRRVEVWTAKPGS